MSTKRKSPHNQRPKGGRVTPSKKGTISGTPVIGPDGKETGAAWFKVKDLEDAGVW